MSEGQDKKTGRSNGPWRSISIALTIICVVLLIVFLVLAFIVGAERDATAKDGEKAATQTAADDITADAASKTAAQVVVSPLPQATERILPTIVWMTDTQHYSESYPHIFKSMTEWVAKHKGALDIRYAIHTGDVVDDRDQPAQWNNAEAALKVLDGAVPLFVIAGNHDISTESRIFDQYLSLLGAERFNLLPTFGGAYGDGIGRFDLVDIGERKYIIAGIGYRPNSEEISWLNDVLAEHADRAAILCVHGYMDADGVLTTDGEQLLPKVIAKNPNIWLVLCGHRHGVYRSTEAFDDDRDGTAERTVYQLLADYQDEERGGNGYLCLLGFDDENGVLRVQTYSPYLGDYDCYDEGNDAEEFTVPLPTIH